MFGISSNKICIFFRKSHFVKHNIIQIRELFITMNAFCLYSHFSNSIEILTNQSWRKVKFRAVQYILILLKDFFIEQRNYLSLEHCFQHFYCSRFCISGKQS